MLARIEGCLQSRRITALSGDPSDLNALTLVHFLIGEAIVRPLVPNVSDTPTIG